MAIKIVPKPVPENAQTPAKPNEAEVGKAAANSLHRETRKEERKVEHKTGTDLPKGEERFEERSVSSDGKSAGDKQN